MDFEADMVGEYTQAKADYHEGLRATVACIAFALIAAYYISPFAKPLAVASLLLGGVASARLVLETLNRRDVMRRSSRQLIEQGVDASALTRRDYMTGYIQPKILRALINSGVSLEDGVKFDLEQS
ncbi:MAG: hypothetical protein NT159_07670 [Proteobacteria bacterium]|nr:hypothetical protein [Pseudomonadota bacterium]